MREQADIAIVGGGAAGLVAAVVTGEALRGRNGRVVLCEASDRVGRSILATGNGRCNFSNARLTAEMLGDVEALEPLYRNAEFVARVFAALEELSQFERDASDQGGSLLECSNAVLRFFAEHGLVWREEAEGRLYPLANKATSVLDVLRAAVAEARVDVLTECSVRAIERQQADGFLLAAEDGRELHAQRVIVAGGGSVDAALADMLGLPFVEQRPVLGPLALDASGKRATKRLDNIRVKARATLLRDHGSSRSPVRSECGEVLFRPYGVSGIAVFDLSRDVRHGDEISLDLLSPTIVVNAEALLAQRAERLRRQSGRPATYGAVLRGMVLPQIAEVLCERVGARTEEACDDAGIESLARVLRDVRFTVEGIGDARQCQVKRGGISVTALGPTTLETVTIPGLFVVGEAADVDAACGGFNLHWAWASGMLAGHAAAQAAMDASEEGR